MTTANHVLLRRITLTASASSVTFDNIPQTGYTDLKIVASARTAYGYYWDGTFLRFNNTTTTYSTKLIYGDGSAAGSFGSSTDILCYFVASSATANTFSNTEIYIPNYTSSNAKSVSIDTAIENNGNPVLSNLCAGLWSGTSAITSIQLVPQAAFQAGSSFSLYGIADVNTTPLTSPKAFGGDIIKTDGTYWYHAFLSSGSFTPQVNLTADVLVVAGGGGGGSGNNSGGGGAGGLLGFTSQALTNATSYTCTVGSGGATGTPNGVNGSDSQFGSFTLVKGGGYGAGESNTGGNGGSGGGNPYNVTTAAGQPTSGQGYAGGPGQGVVAPDYYGGGGGGAGEAGNTDAIGYGGDGSSAYSSWGSATGTGHNVSGTYYYAGGGGGAGQLNAVMRQGGDGGGGYGSGNGVAPAAGTANTGGGGGGSGNSAGNNGKAGGSGIIIVRYAV